MDFRDTPLRLPQTLTDGVVRLDGHTLADAEAHWAGEDEEMMRRFDSPRKGTLEQTRAAMERWIAARAAGGPEFAYALRQPVGLLMGGCATYPLAADRANVSYWIFPAFRGRGYVTRAVALLCEAVGRVPGLTWIEAHVDADNIASRRVAEKSGFVEEGTVVDEAWSGEPRTRLRYIKRVVRSPHE
jgi:RimJ/RimL family protein N-acetyltransferase